MKGKILLILFLLFSSLCLSQDLDFKDVENIDILDINRNRITKSPVKPERAKEIIRELPPGTYILDKWTFDNKNIECKLKITIKARKEFI